MKNLLITLLLSIILFSSKKVLAQNIDKDFSEILSNYHLSKDSGIVEKSIDYLNKTQMDYEILSSIVTGFYGAVFLNDEAIKKDFGNKITLLKKPKIKRLMIFLLSSNIDTVYSKAKVSITLNTMNWSSFFATGNTKYLDHIIENIQYVENRTDRNLFLAGASAKTSLCANSKKSDSVYKYLNSLIEKKPFLKEILENDPKYFQNEMIDILKIQRENRLWN
ncbi:hypothetical protein ACFOG5_12445 [Pedobacter fastidiosus]|uniref:Uncharacterized protein n=1 Tax=Pedobacter fastidiosus TaxID=2765361 RepID=A0ABR7KMG3_9SPHI|nr:hypothetical protein [Pedobacter fastidiosus]MBC6109149.1 hypothetical protein [Pedobacter fastidiosus]